MTYQTDEKHLINVSEYFVGVVNIAFNRYNNRFLLSIILTKSSDQISTSVSVKNVKNSSGVTKGEFLTHIGVHQCVKHGAKMKCCSPEGCTNQVVKGGVAYVECWKDQKLEIKTISNSVLSYLI